MKSGKVSFIFIAILLLVIVADAQFYDVSVEISIDRMPEKERMDLKTLEQMIPYYFESYDWFENTYGLEIPLKISMFPEAVNSSGFERVFSSQFLISNETADQRFFEKGFKFVYNSNDPLMHSEMTHSLASAFDFYAYMFIAGELDTYDPLGGNNIYDKARDIATRGQVSERSSGWKSRLQDLDEIQRLRDYRLVKYYYWLTIDNIDRENPKAARETIDTMLMHLKRMFDINARERYTHIFLDVHARDIAEIIRGFGTPAQLDIIITLDPDNEAIYKELGVSK
ncbi:MAG: DUF4835 family protein [bacterium]